MSLKEKINKLFPIKTFLSNSVTEADEKNNTLLKGENAAKFPAGPTTSRPGPILLIVVITDVTVVTTSKLSKEIIAYEKVNYVLNYPFICSKVQLKLYRFTSQYSLDQTTISSVDNEYYELYNFEKCPLRKIFVLYIKIGKIMPGTYRCQLTEWLFQAALFYFTKKMHNNFALFDKIRQNSTI